MTLPSRRYADVTVAAPAGRIDSESAARLEAAVVPLLDADASPAGIVLDFARVDYISSVGLRVLMIAAKSVRARGGRIGVAALSPVVAEIFAISRFDAVVHVFPTVRDALAAISPSALASYAAHAPAGAA